MCAGAIQQIKVEGVAGNLKMSAALVLPNQRLPITGLPRFSLCYKFVIVVL